MWMQCVRSALARSGVLFWRPMWILRARGFGPRSSGRRTAQEERPEPSVVAAQPVGEFDFGRAIEAYEAVIDSACRERGRCATWR